MKRSIGSVGGPTSSTTATFTPSTGGLLFPYLRHILYALHLIYEECKLYRSLDTYCKSLIQIQYLLANELNLPLYMTYYEAEYPFLLKLKSMKVFTTTTGNSNGTNISINLNSKSSSGYLSSIMSQEPPVLYKFLMKLIEEPTDSDSGPNEGIKKPPASPTFFLNSMSMDSSMLNQADTEIINPFPVIGSVTKRTIKTIKIYALIALSTKKSFKNMGFNSLLNQLFFKVNFSGSVNKCFIKMIKKIKIKWVWYTVFICIGKQHEF